MSKFVLAGVTGRVGSVAASDLLAGGESVTVIVRDAKKAADHKPILGIAWKVFSGCCAAVLGGRIYRRGASHRTSRAGAASGNGRPTGFGKKLGLDCSTSLPEWAGSIGNNQSPMGCLLLQKKG